MTETKITRADMRSGSKTTVSAITAGPPASPADGDIWIATNVLPGSGNTSPSSGSGNAFNGVTWAFVYESGNGSAKKWQFIGGAPLIDFKLPATTDGAAFASATWGDCTGNEPRVYAPRAGEYTLEFGVHQAWTTPVANLLVGAALNGGTPSDPLSIWPGSDSSYHAAQGRWPAVMASNDYYNMRQKQNGGGVQTITLGYRWLSITPIRIS